MNREKKHCDMCDKELEWYDILGGLVVHDAPKPIKQAFGPTLYTYGKVRLCFECAMKHREKPYALDAKAYELRGTNIYE